jgi:hypothetical protein
MMAASLALVRATTQPALETGRNSTSATVTGASSSAARPVAEDVKARALLVDPLFAQRPEGHSQTGNNPPPSSERPVSATAVILAIPAPIEAAGPHIGWSGCGAYAVGCDHLGRSLTDGKDDEIVGALSARRF